MTKVKYNPIGYQVVDKYNTHIHPDIDASFCIYSKPQALEMIKSTENEVDTEWRLLPILEGDIEEPTFMFDGDPETATEKNDPIVEFKAKLKALAIAAQELEVAWDAVDGDKRVNDAFDPTWPFREELYYHALAETSDWCNKTANNLQ